MAEQPQIAVLESTNSLLVNATPRQHAAIALVIAHVDREPETTSTPYVVYPLENQDPEELAAVLDELVNATIQAETQKTAARTTTGTTGTTPGDGENDGADSRIQTSARPTGMGGQRSENEVTIVPDKASYSLIVYGNKKNQQWISQLIKVLDDYRPQVLLDVTLVEISKDNESPISEWMPISERSSPRSRSAVHHTHRPHGLELAVGRCASSAVTRSCRRASSGAGAQFWFSAWIVAVTRPAPPPTPADRVAANPPHQRRGRLRLDQHIATDGAIAACCRGVAFTKSELVDSRTAICGCSATISSAVVGWPVSPPSSSVTTPVSRPRPSIGIHHRTLLLRSRPRIRGLLSIPRTLLLPRRDDRQFLQRLHDLRGVHELDLVFLHRPLVALLGVDLAQITSAISPCCSSVRVDQQRIGRLPDADLRLVLRSPRSPPAPSPATERLPASASAFATAASGSCVCEDGLLLITPSSNRVLTTSVRVDILDFVFLDRPDTLLRNIQRIDDLVDDLDVLVGPDDEHPIRPVVGLQLYAVLRRRLPAPPPRARRRCRRLSPPSRSARPLPPLPPPKAAPPGGVVSRAGVVPPSEPRRDGNRDRPQMAGHRLDLRGDLAGLVELDKPFLHALLLAFDIHQVQQLPDPFHPVRIVRHDQGLRLRNGIEYIPELHIGQHILAPVGADVLER